MEKTMEAAKKDEKKDPQLSVKIKGGSYIGSGWMNEGQYGKYVSIKIDVPIAKGSTLYLAPRKGHEGIF